MLKKLLLAAAAVCAFAYACVPVMADESEKTEVNDSREFDDFTSEWSLMNRTLQTNCYVGSHVLKTVQLTVQGTNSNEVQLGNHSALNAGSSESTNSTFGTYEVTQLKTRLA